MAQKATDHALDEERTRGAAAKRSVAPLRTLASMAAALGGTWVLLLGVRFMLTVCMLLASAAVFYALLTLAKFSIALSLVTVGAINFALAIAMLAVIMMQKPGYQGKLMDLFRRGGSSEVRMLRLPVPTRGCPEAAWHDSFALHAQTLFARAAVGNVVRLLASHVPHCPFWLATCSCRVADISDSVRAWNRQVAQSSRLELAVMHGPASAWAIRLIAAQRRQARLAPLCKA